MTIQAMPVGYARMEKCHDVKKVVDDVHRPAASGVGQATTQKLWEETHAIAH
ncbi:MAG: hypothetical protein AB4042_16150 [Leptolyngbyaceae cyanobacterium]